MPGLVSASVPTGGAVLLGTSRASRQAWVPVDVPVVPVLVPVALTLVMLLSVTSAPATSNIGPEVENLTEVTGPVRAAPSAPV